MEACIFNIQRFSTRDGPGIRTTAFFQGCNLRCAWCHNPESIPREPRLQYFPDKCAHCGRCADVCPRGAHAMVDGEHAFAESLCRYCGACAVQCPGGALHCGARWHTPESLCEIALRDLAYYQNSGGGVTLSGGEPMLRADFAAAVCELARRGGAHTAIDTAAAVPWAALQRVLPVCDLFLVDLKGVDPEVHSRYTGADNAQVLRNIRLLSERGAEIEIRMPLIGGVNDSPEDARGAAAFLRTLARVPPVRLLPYHNYGLYKAQSVRAEMREFRPPDSIAAFADALRARDIHVEGE